MYYRPGLEPVQAQGQQTHYAILRATSSEVSSLFNARPSCARLDLNSYFSLGKSETDNLILSNPNFV